MDSNFRSLISRSVSRRGTPVCRLDHQWQMDLFTSFGQLSESDSINYMRKVASLARWILARRR